MSRDEVFWKKLRATRKLLEAIERDSRARTVHRRAARKILFRFPDNDAISRVLQEIRGRSARAAGEDLDWIWDRFVTRKGAAARLGLLEDIETVVRKRLAIYDHLVAAD